MRYLVPVPKQYLDESGVPYSNGTVTVYLAGTMDLAEIYQNAYDDELAPNPSVLDSNGMWQAFADAGVALDYVVADADGNTITSYNGIVIDGGAGGGVSKTYVDTQDNSIRSSVSSLAEGLAEEISTARAAEAAAMTEVRAGTGINVVQTTGSDGHYIYQINNNNGNSAPSYGRFTQTNAVADQTGSCLYESLMPIMGTGIKIFVVNGQLLVNKGIFHIDFRILVRNTEVNADYYAPAITVGSVESTFTWDNSYVHGESVGVSCDFMSRHDNTPIALSISGLPAGVGCSLESLDVHEVIGVGSASGGTVVEHNASLEGDGTFINPLSVVVDSSLDLQSGNPVSNGAVKAAIDGLESGKQDVLTEMTQEEVAQLVDSLD